MHLPPEHAAVLESIRASVADDGRFDGLAAGGSLLTEDMDQYSDLDLVLVVADEHHAAVMDQRREIAASWRPMLAAFTGEHVGESRLLICLFADPLMHVDLKFLRVDELFQRIEDPLVLWERDGIVSRSMTLSEATPQTMDPQWLEDRFWIWVHYAATKLGRGELFEVMEFLAFLRGHALAPLALHVRGCSPRGVRRFEQLAPDLTSSFARTASSHAPSSCAAAIEQSVDLYRNLRSQLASPLRLNKDAEVASIQYLHQVIRTDAIPGPLT